MTVGSHGRGAMDLEPDVIVVGHDRGPLSGRHGSADVPPVSGGYRNLRTASA